MTLRSSGRRPPQPPTPPPDAFEVHRATVNGVELAYVREGVGGYPLLLLHGYPETKRIWWRNIGPLVAAGYEVIVPDLRGYGDSGLSPDDAYDLVLYSRDCHALVHDVLGHPRCGAVAGDVGGVVIVDLALRFRGFVDKLVFFNTVPPTLWDRPDLYEAAGIALAPHSDPGAAPTGDYRVRQGRDHVELLAELDTAEKRRRYVAAMYTHRLWASAGSFTDDDVAFHTEPFADAGHLAASWAPYQLSYGRPMSEAPMLGRPVDVPTLVLYGPEDHVVDPDFVARCEIAFTQRVGPVLVPGAGHFLQWERADVLNGLVAHFFAAERDRHAAGRREWAARGSNPEPSD